MFDIVFVYLRVIVLMIMSEVYECLKHVQMPVYVCTCVH